jgi:hypothetical protein
VHSLGSGQRVAARSRWRGRASRRTSAIRVLFVFAVVSKRLCDARPVVQVFGIASWGINNDWKSTGVCSNASGPITPHIARVPPRIPPCNNVCKEPSWHSPAVSGAAGFFKRSYIAKKQNMSCTHRKCMSVRPTASSDRTLYTHGKCMSVRLTAGMLRARERVWRSLRTPQQSLWMGGLGGFLHMVAGTFACGTPLLMRRLVGLAVAKVRGAGSYNGGGIPGTCSILHGHVVADRA